MPGKTLAEFFDEEARQQSAPPKKREKRPKRVRRQRDYKTGGRTKVNGPSLGYRLKQDDYLLLVATAETLNLSLYETSSLLVREALQARKDNHD